MVSLLTRLRAKLPKIRTRLSPNRSSRRGAKIIGAVIHTTESSPGSLNGVVGYLCNPNVEVSSHYVVGDVEVGKTGWTEVVRLVPESEKAWTAKSANPYFVQYELVGRAARTYTEWLKHEAQLRTVAALVAEDSLQYGFPVKRSVPGIVGHGDLTRFGYPNEHWDPGPNFPWRSFLKMVEEFRTAAAAKPPVKDVPVPPGQNPDFWKWVRWWRGHGEFKSYGPRNKAVRPNVPKRIPAAWWARLKANATRR
jgi:N-acetyl-anhydromuramyl-L-alanine amidase AmpD